MKPKSILQINTRDQRGGAENIAQTLHMNYQVRGQQSQLVVGKKYSLDSTVWEIRHAQSVKRCWKRMLLFCIESLSPLRTYGFRGVAALQTRLCTWDMLKQLPHTPDIIHCHNLHGDYFDLRILPWLGKQHPVILHLHDSWLLSGHCAYSLDCERWKIGCGKCPYLDTYPAIPHDRTAANWQRKRDIYARSNLYIVTVSKWLMNQVNASMLQGVQQRVIHNGVDTKKFYPMEQQVAREMLKLPMEANIILYTAHSGFKDVAMIRTALEKLQGKNLLFVCVGKEIGHRQLGNGQLIQRGYIKGAEQMAHYYRAADLYLHAAKADSFPTTVLEALACGTPIVATSVGGISEQIQDGKTGFLVPSQSPIAIAQAVQTLLDDKELCQRMGKAAAIYAKKYFDLEVQVDTFLDWYDEVYTHWDQSHDLSQKSKQRIAY